MRALPLRSRLMQPATEGSVTGVVGGWDGVDGGEAASTVVAVGRRRVRLSTAARASGL